MNDGADALDRQQLRRVRGLPADDLAQRRVGGDRVGGLAVGALAAPGLQRRELVVGDGRAVLDGRRGFFALAAVIGGSQSGGSWTSQQRPSGAPGVGSPKWSSSWRRRQRSPVAA